MQTFTIGAHERQRWQTRLAKAERDLTEAQYLKAKAAADVDQHPTSPRSVTLHYEAMQRVDHLEREIEGCIRTLAVIEPDPDPEPPALVALPVPIRTIESYPLAATHARWSSTCALTGKPIKQGDLIIFYGPGWCLCKEAEEHETRLIVAAQGRRKATTYADQFIAFMERLPIAVAA